MSSLKGLLFAQLFKIVVDNDVFLDWEWHSAKVKKAPRRPRDSHLITDVKFAGESGPRSIGLSDGKQYTSAPSSAHMDVAWVLLVEVRDGAKAREKLKKKRKATSEEHDGDDSGGGGGGDGEDETAGGGGGGAAKPAKRKKGKHAKKK